MSEPIAPTIPTVSDVKANLILTGDDEDSFISSLISAAVSYAEAFQHLPDGFYTTVPAGASAPPEMAARTKQAVIMLVTSWFESRDGGSGGFFQQSAAAGAQASEAVDNLLRLDRDWKV